MEIHNIYMYVCMCVYSFFYGTFTRASMNNLDSATNITFHAGVVMLSSSSNIVLINK